MRQKGANALLKGLEKDATLKEQYKEPIKEIKSYLDKIKKDSKRQSNQPPSHQPPSNQPSQDHSDRDKTVGTAFIGGSFGSQPESYPLFESWILDSGSANHITNQKE